MIMAVREVAPALAAGNSVVLAQREKPLTALRLAELRWPPAFHPCSTWCQAKAPEAGSSLAAHGRGLHRLTGRHARGREIHDGRAEQLETRLDRTWR
jgi:acyl-CoA reductase-like NAD-dependent aldehyde dehydrogenase